MNFEQDWFLRQIEMLAEGAARKLLKRPAHEEYVDVKQFGGDDLIYYRLCALLARHDFCAAEDLLWEHLRPEDPDQLPLVEEFYRQLGGFSNESLEAHGFSRREVREGLARAREFAGGGAMHMRSLRPEDAPLLEEFLYQAIFLPPGAQAPERDVIHHPDIFKYIDQFGSLPEDCGVVAQAGGEVVGAAWVRVVGAYGYVDDETPELAISVLPQWRGQGVGTALLTRLFEELAWRGWAQTSLSVHKANPALRLYRRLGYETLRENEEDLIMIKRLARREGDGS